MIRELFTAILLAAMSVNASHYSDSEPAGQKRMAVVETSTCYMRIQPDYESALETQELMGTVVEIVGEKGYWREIVSPQPYRAWVTEKTLVEMTPEQIKEYEEAPKYMFTGLYGHIYSEPSDKSQTICDLVGGDVMRIVMREDGKRTGKDGSGDRAGSCGKDGSGDRAGSCGKDGSAGKDGSRKVRPVVKGGWARVMLPSGRTGWVQRKTVEPLQERFDIRIGDRAEGLVSMERMEDIIASAERLLGVPYLWGGMSSKGVDCSGLVRISCILNGVLLPRNASQMVRCGDGVEIPPLSSLGRNDREEGPQEGASKRNDRQEALERTRNLQRGDLVFFGTPASGDKPMRVTHVGIYLGNNRIIHSSHLVRINSLIPGDEDYYENAHRLIAARRLVH